MNTEILKISIDDDDFDLKITKAAEIIKVGGLVVFPTETVYGLGADGTNATAATKIYAAKGRPADNPLIIHIEKPEDASLYAYVSEEFFSLAAQFMPGPLTVILRAKDTVPEQTRGGLSTVAVRCPKNPIARALIAKAGVPIAAPSANLSGSPSPTKAKHVISDMSGRVDMILDGGESDFGLESTIVKLEDDGGATLLRPGKITPEELIPHVKYLKIANAVTNELSEGEQALSPGMKYRHYAPKAPVYLIEGGSDAVLEYLRERVKKKKIAVIAYSDEASLIRSSVNAFVYEFGNRNDEEMQAHRLFDILRDADTVGFDEIYAPTPRKEGLGLALYNRLIRAAAHHIIRM